MDPLWTPYALWTLYGPPMDPTTDAQSNGAHDRLSHTNIKDWFHDRLSHTNIKDWFHDRLSHKHQGLGP